MIISYTRIRFSYKCLGNFSPAYGFKSKGITLDLIVPRCCQVVKKVDLVGSLYSSVVLQFSFGSTTTEHQWQLPADAATKGEQEAEATVAVFLQKYIERASQAKVRLSHSIAI
ncbi:hypothetical protein R1flu_014498 [Riccia fluitans]|uniref:Uncharacterized protein n=1 Tax=Riccia fluitans TaxID=41844 RepID=A0ABD1YK23_9MARC